MDRSINQSINKSIDQSINQFDMEGPLVVKFVTNLSPKNGTNPFRAKSQKKRPADHKKQQFNVLYVSQGN